MTVAGITGATQISAGNSFAFALLSDATVSGWGANDDWQLGGGNDTDDVVSIPIPVRNVSNATRIAAFGTGGYAIVGDDGEVCSWGTGRSGELGHGPASANTASNGGVVIQGLSGVVHIAGSNRNGYARLDDRTLLAWRAGSSGQIGNGDTADQFTPVAVGRVRGAGRIAAHGRSAYTTLVFGLSNPDGGADLNINVWGLNSSGQLGDGTTIDRSTRIAVQTTNRVTALAIDSTSATKTFFIR